MQQNNLPPDIQLLLSRDVSSRSRDVYKEENKEIQNYSSRHLDEDDDGVKTSTRSAFEPEAIASNSLAFVSDKDSLESGTSSPGRETLSQERGIVISPPRDVSSRYSGISVQHVITSKGVKVAMTLQKPEWAAAGECQMATAELKKYDRMREIKSREDDSDHFNAYLANTKAQLQDAANKDVCIGRFHERGKRSLWIKDTLIVAFFVNGRMSQVLLYLNGEEHLVDLNLELSPAQQKYYHSQGIHGQIQSAAKAPTLDDLPRVKFGG